MQVNMFKTLVRPDQVAGSPVHRGPALLLWNRSAGFAFFAGLAALSGATSVLVLHSVATSGGDQFTTGSIDREVIARNTMVSLARSALLRLDDANRSGNYDIFRQMAAPGFQNINSARDLERIFGWLRRENIRLDVAAGLNSDWMSPAALEPRGLLRLTGKVPSRPKEVNFDLMFQDIAGEWRLFGIAIYRS